MSLAGRCPAQTRQCGKLCVDAQTHFGFVPCRVVYISSHSRGPHLLSLLFLITCKNLWLNSNSLPANLQSKRELVRQELVCEAGRSTWSRGSSSSAAHRYSIASSHKRCLNSVEQIKILWTEITKITQPSLASSLLTPLNDHVSLRPPSPHSSLSNPYSLTIYALRYTPQLWQLTTDLTPHFGLS